MGLDTYLADVVVGNEGMPGAPLLHVSALVVVPSGLISGHAEITQAIQGPAGDVKISDLKGRIHEVTLHGEKFRLVNLSGTYIRSLPPPAIGEILEHFSAMLLLEGTGPWIGCGSFTYATNHVEDVPVAPEIHMGAEPAAAGAAS
jgi:hypothetical protein